jgi:glycosyltransferase involved in cell wall biosynthesis
LAAVTGSARLVSIVVPLFNEGKNVGPLFEELEVVTATIEDVTIEYVFVDDGSHDDSLLVLAQLASKHPKVKVVSLARNFGKELALTAGVIYAQGEAVVTMDADLQHPPALLPALVEKWLAGADVVVAARRATTRKTILRRVFSRLFSMLERLLSGNERIEEGGTDYRLIDKKVRAAFLLVRERRRAYRQIVDWLGFTRKTVEFDAGERHEGSSTYSLSKLWTLAIDMLISRSSVPLRLLFYMGFLISLAATLSLAWMFLAIRYVDPRWYYTPLAQATVFNTLLIGVLLTAIGVVGLYVARIHEEVLGRPLFTVRATLNMPDDASAATKRAAKPEAAE